jgi:hypothetical protein
MNSIFYRLQCHFCISFSQVWSYQKALFQSNQWPENTDPILFNPIKNLAAIFANPFKSFLHFQYPLPELNFQHWRACLPTVNKSANPAVF